MDWCFCYCDCVNDAGDDFASLFLRAWTEGSSFFLKTKVWSVAQAISLIKWKWLVGMACRVHY
ncbi:hypothetical protein QUC31_005766 [Theobroma cacao]